MEKDFNKWNDKKNSINDISDIPNFHEREIWICFLGLNIGFEQDGAGDNFDFKSQWRYYNMVWHHS